MNLEDDHSLHTTRVPETPPRSLEESEEVEREDEKLTSLSTLLLVNVDSCSVGEKEGGRAEEESNSRQVAAEDPLLEKTAPSIVSEGEREQEGEGEGEGEGGEGRETDGDDREKVESVDDEHSDNEDSMEGVEVKQEQPEEEGEKEWEQ